MTSSSALTQKIYLTDFESQFDEEPFTHDLSLGFGYANICIGDRLGPDNQFEILRKLGWGMYATMWLVKDHQQGRFLALKILTAYGTLLERGAVNEPGHPHTQELDIMQKVSTPTSDPGANNCMKLIDSFYITRDTNDHLCLLTEVAGPNLEGVRAMVATDGAFPSKFVKLFVKQICLALNYPHTECRVVHTDIKPSNLLLAFDSSITEELINTLLENRPVQTYPMPTVDGVKMEAFVSQPLPLPGFDDVDPVNWVIKVADFGSAQFIDRRTTDRVQPVQLRAPEVVLGLDWNEKIDIWSLGCLTFELLTGKNLYEASPSSQWSSEENLLAAQLETHLLTRVPPHLHAQCKDVSLLLNQDGSLRNIPEDMMYPKTLADVLSVYKKAPINLDDPPSERELASSFIERCLALDARERDTAAELLQHPWLNQVSCRPLRSRLQLQGDNVVVS
ncbi:kinase-like domain-containing protein, partial [Crucibulum laeve]